MSLIGTMLRRLFGGHATPPESAAVHESPGTAPEAAPSDWFVSNEEREQERIVERVCERLEAGVVRVDFGSVAAGRSEFSQTCSGLVQSRVLPLQRAGFCARASS